MKETFASLLFLTFVNLVFAQDFINPYKSYAGLLNADVSYTSANGGLQYWDGRSNLISYNGELMVCLSRMHWGNLDLLDPGSSMLPSNYLKTLTIENVSFPFTPPCAFDNSIWPTGGCADGLTGRIFKMPINTSYIQPNPTLQNFAWRSNNANLYNLDLYNKYTAKFFLTNDYQCFLEEPLSLISKVFMNDNGLGSDRKYFPHSILKFTVNLHCGLTFNDAVISSFTFYYDFTRGMLRHYPFLPTNTDPGNVNALYDVVFVPEIYPSTDYLDYTASENCFIYSDNEPASSAICNGNYPLSRGSTIDYSDFDIASDDACNVANYSPVDLLADPYILNSGFTKLLLPPFTLLGSVYARDYKGEILCGYEKANVSGNSFNYQPIVSVPALHTYTIDQNIDLNLFNTNHEIYNPSEIEVTASNLIFPSNYVFKTFRATYPYYDEVMAANTAANGCDGNTLLKNVPVITDLRYEGTDPKYNASDPWFSAIYRLHAGSKITIENCVKLFDCTFDLLPNSKIVFQNYATNQVNVDRYKVLLNGGVYSRGRHDWVFQNKMETDKVLEFFSDNEILAGKDVDLLQPAGDYVVMPSANVSFISKTSVRLLPGFEAREGCQFLAAIDPSVVIPDCSFSPLRTSGNQRPEAGLNFIPPHKGERVPAVLNLVCEPNPATDMVNLTVQLNIPDKVTISIFNPQMQVVKQVGNEWWQGDASFTYSIGLENLSSGVYYCSVKGSISQKIVKLIKL